VQGPSVAQPSMCDRQSAVTKEAADAQSAFAQTRRLARLATTGIATFAAQQALRGLKGILKAPVTAVNCADYALWGKQHVVVSHLLADVEVLTSRSPSAHRCWMERMT
jgi:hypothetical protein